jgi:DNA invertase Pin-like site-specific DNA recombinase
MVTKLDRPALHQVAAIAREFEALGVDLVVLDQAIDPTTPTGRPLYHVLGAFAEFECDLVRDRVRGGPPMRSGARKASRPSGRPRRAVDAEEVRRRWAASEPWLQSNPTVLRLGMAKRRQRIEPRRPAGGAGVPPADNRAAET